MSISKAEFALRIAKYVPEHSATWVTDMVFQHGIGLTIKKGRKSKLGDYRAPHGGKGHRISVNFELNAEEFLLTFIHELAHLICFEKHHHKVNPHGREWKQIYSGLMSDAIHFGFFHEDLRPALIRHIKAPGATSCSDPELRLALSGETDLGTLLHQIDEGEVFKIGHMIFEKGPLQRTRYRCLNLANKRYYLVPKHAPIEKIDPESTQ
jgi:hypothetical protein